LRRTELKVKWWAKVLFVGLDLHPAPVAGLNTQQQ
jgi:hypothetical protein